MRTLQHLLKDLQGSMVCPDTNAARYLGTAFAKTPLPDHLRNKMLSSPVTIVEVISQLATSAAPEVLDQIQSDVELAATRGPSVGLA